MRFPGFGTVWLTVLVDFVHLGHSMIMDNGLVGTPQITCGNNMISILFKTQKSFAGSVYAKGNYAKDECRVRGTNSEPSVMMKVPVNFECGMRRKRVLSPSRGIVLEAIVVIMFHPIFLTKVDRSFRVQCLYMEADKLVTQKLDVSTLPPTDLPGNVDDSRMPICQYEVLRGGSSGQSIKYATIGESVYHKWSCTGPQADIYCMTVHSCTADDGQGIGQLLIDDKGCSQDKFLLDNLNYSNDMTAGQEAHVFKFADRQTIFFGCQIRLELKEELGGACPRETCPEPSESGGSHPIETPQRKNSLDDEEIDGYGGSSAGKSTKPYAQGIASVTPIGSNSYGGTDSNESHFTLKSRLTPTTPSYGEEEGLFENDSSAPGKQPSSAELEKSSSSNERKTSLGNRLKGAQTYGNQRSSSAETEKSLNEGKVFPNRLKITRPFGDVDQPSAEIEKNSNFPNDDSHSGSHSANSDHVQSPKNPINEFHFKPHPPGINSISVEDRTYDNNVNEMLEHQESSESGNHQNEAHFNFNEKIEDSTASKIDSTQESKTGSSQEMTGSEGISLSEETEGSDEGTSGEILSKIKTRILTTPSSRNSENEENSDLDHGGYRQRRDRNWSQPENLNRLEENQKKAERFLIDMDVVGSVEVLDAVPTETLDPNDENESLQRFTDRAKSYRKDKICLPRPIVLSMLVLFLCIFSVTLVSLWVLQSKRQNVARKKHSFHANS